MLDISLYFNESLFEGTGLSGDVPGLRPVGLAGHSYIIDPQKYQRNTVDVMRTPYDTQTDPGENSLNTLALWKKSAFDWRLGAGQEFFDASDSDPRMFRLSKGIDPWTVGKAKLLPDTSLKRASVNTNLQLLVVGIYVYVIDGTSLLRTSDFTSFTAVTGLTASPVDITSDGSNVYVANASGIDIVATAGTAAVAFSTQPAMVVAYANGRLLAANGSFLWEIDSTGGATPVWNHPLTTSVSIVAIVGTPAGTFFALNTGDRGETYFVGVNTSTGALSAVTFAGELNSGETINTMIFYGARFLLGTSRGLRVAELVGDRGLAPSSVIDAPGPVTCLEGRAEFVWFSWANLDGVSTGLGRADLSTFTDVIVPAYASDLMATAQGTVQSVVTFGEKRYFAVSGAGFYGESTNKVASGTLYSGRLRFKTFELKNFVSMGMRHEPLDGTVVITLIQEDTTAVNAAQSLTPGAVEPQDGESEMTAAGEWCEVLVTMTRSATDATKGPVLLRWGLRAMVVPVRTDEIILPIIMHTEVNFGNKDHSFDPLVEFQALKALEASRAIVTYQEGNLTERVVVDKVGVQPSKWDQNTDWFQGYIVCRLLTTNIGGS